MLTVTIPETETFDPVTNTFYTIRSQKLSLEHSLVSISKWESKWHKPFLTNDPKSREQVVDYIKCMTLTQNVDPKVYECIPDDTLTRINDYIDDPMTATWFSEDKQKTKRSREVITSELIYFWMIQAGIPFECQKWHLNRLITLIRVCAKKSEKPKKISKRKTLDNWSALNAARKAKLNTRG